MESYGRLWKPFYNLEVSRLAADPPIRITTFGPGAFVLLTRAGTLSLQANAVYDTLARDELLGRPSNRTGSTAWYLGPLLTLTWGAHFSANLGIDVPLRIANNGFQNVADYIAHGGLSWRF